MLHKTGNGERSTKVCEIRRRIIIDCPKPCVSELIFDAPRSLLQCFRRAERVKQCIRHVTLDGIIVGEPTNGSAAARRYRATELHIMQSEYEFRAEYLH